MVGWPLIAERFLEDDDSVDLTGFTTIEDRTAGELSQCSGDLSSLLNNPVGRALLPVFQLEN